MTQLMNIQELANPTFTLASHGREHAFVVCILTALIASHKCSFVCNARPHKIFLSIKCASSWKAQQRKSLPDKCSSPRDASQMEREDEMLCRGHSTFTEIDDLASFFAFVVAAAELMVPAV
jgi:hypothetical protein